MQSRVSVAQCVIPYDKPSVSHAMWQRDFDVVSVVCANGEILKIVFLHANFKLSHLSYVLA